MGRDREVGATDGLYSNWGTCSAANRQTYQHLYDSQVAKWLLLLVLLLLLFAFILSLSLSRSCLPLSLLLPQRVVHFANEQQALPCCHRYRLLPSACCLLPTLLPCRLLLPPYELISCRCTVGWEVWMLGLENVRNIRLGLNGMHVFANLEFDSEKF